MEMAPGPTPQNLDLYTAGAIALGFAALCLGILLLRLAALARGGALRRSCRRRAASYGLLRFAIKLAACGVLAHWCAGLQPPSDPTGLLFAPLEAFHQSLLESLRWCAYLLFGCAGFATAAFLLPPEESAGGPPGSLPRS